MNDRLLNNPVPPREIDPDISPQLQEIIYRALERDPKNRYANAREFAWDLEHQDQVGVAERAELQDWKKRRTPWARKILFYAHDRADSDRGLRPAAVGRATWLSNEEPMRATVTIAAALALIAASVCRHNSSETSLSPRLAPLPHSRNSSKASKICTASNLTKRPKRSRQVQKIDPDFALAYWGEALSYNHPLWAQLDLPAAKKALERLAPTAEGRLAKAHTEKEKAYPKPPINSSTPRETSWRGTTHTARRWRACTTDGPMITKSRFFTRSLCSALCDR